MVGGWKLEVGSFERSVTR